MLGLFAAALCQVQSVPVGDCPFDASAAVCLRELDYLLAHALVADDIDLQQWPGLRTPADLREHLHATVPIEDLVFSHGDPGDSNVFVDARDELYFIDVGALARPTVGSISQSSIATCATKVRRRWRRRF